MEAVGLDGDMLEAQAFAYLAVRVLRGLPTSGPGWSGVATGVGGEDQPARRLRSRAHPTAGRSAGAPGLPARGELGPAEDRCAQT